MSARSNPPSFVVIDSVTGRVGYTKRATGVGNEAIAACAAKAREIARKTGHPQIVFLELRKLYIGQQLNVGAVRAMGITEEIHPDGSVTRNNPRRSAVRRNIFTFNNPYGSIEGADKDAARELELYIENDADLYRQQYLPIIKNLMLKRRKGIFNPQLAAKLFLYLVEAGAKKYCQQFGGVWHKMFSMPTRQLVANHFVFGFSAEADLGNYDHLLVKPTKRGLKAAVSRRGASSEFEMDMGMYEKGYRYKLIPRSRAFDPLYAKTTMDVARVMREYKNDTFDTVDLRPPTSAHENPGRYVVYDFKRGCVVSRVMTTRQATNLRDSLNQKGERVRGDLRYGLMTPKNARGEDIDLGGDYVRKNIFTFNNPRGGDNQVEAAARSAGLAVATWAPGDGVTRYRFFLAKGGSVHADYHQGDGIYTALGRKEALNFIRSFGLGKSTRPNPLTRAEAGQELKFAREAMQRMADSQRAGVSGAADFGYAQGIAGVVGRRGPRAAVRTAERVMRHARYNPVCPNPCRLKHRHIRRNPSPIDPPGLAELDARMNDLMRKMDAMKKAKTDGGPEYMILLKEAQAVSKERLKLIGLGQRILPNPLLQTVFAANPPISVAWNAMTRRQREAILEVVGYDRDYQGGMTFGPWSSLPAHAKRKLEAQWLDTTSGGGTTRRRSRTPVAVNPLTRNEAGRVISDARRDIRHGSSFSPGFTRSERAGQAFAKAKVVYRHGPKSAKRAAIKVADRAQKMAGTTLSNPGVRLPKPGTRLTIAQALDLAQRLGNRELVKQCHAAMKLQKKANRGAKCVIWKIFPMGSSDKIDQVVALTHYGDSPETMYRPPSGSKKGPHMYRHKWGEGGGAKKTVPLLASPDGKMLMMPLEGKKIASDWLRH